MLYDYSYWIFKQCPIIHNNPYLCREHYLPPRKMGKVLTPYLYKRHFYYRCRDRLN